MQYILNRIRTASNTIAHVDENKWKIDWLLQLGYDYSRIANLGCNIGEETLALHWCLRAKETIGIDIDNDNIDQAISTMKYLRGDFEAIKHSLLYIKNIPNDIRESIKNLLQQYDNCTLPTFVSADITQKTEFESNYFDLIYCERVLYLIACNDRESRTKKLVSAIQEIARITKPGGLIVAIEPKTCSPKNITPIDLSVDFNQAGFIKVEEQEISTNFENKEIYIYLKPA